MAENRRGKDQDSHYYFSRGQLGILAGGFIVTSLVVFFLGVLIGQRIEERKLLKKEEPLVKLPVRPSAQSGSARGAPAKEEMTFYDTLTKAPASKKPTSKKPGQGVKKVLPAKGTVKPSVEKVTGVPPKGVQRDSGTETRKRVWAVQVNAFPHKRDSTNLAKKLKTKGYDAYVVSVNIRGRTWHRVRVGHFATRKDARELQKVLKTKEKFTRAITVSR
ncbi:MAG: SPOR domain-containing protein [Candidatus Binatia bacterium]